MSKFLTDIDVCTLIIYGHRMCIYVYMYVYGYLQELIQLPKRKKKETLIHYTNCSMNFWVPWECQIIIIFLMTVIFRF